MISPSNVEKARVPVNSAGWPSSNRLLKKPENVSSSFDRLRMRSSLFKGLNLSMNTPGGTPQPRYLVHGPCAAPVSELGAHGELVEHELVAVRRAHREAMGDIVFQHPAMPSTLRL